MKTIVRFWLIAALSFSVAPRPASAQSPRLDPSFFGTTAVGHPGSAPGFADLILQPDGKLIVGGTFVSINGSPAFDVARLLPNGQVDPTFTAPPADGLVRSLALQADGKILMGGDFLTIGGQSRIGLARLLPNGALDPSFLSPLGGNPPPFAYSNVKKVVVQSGRGVIILGAMIPQGSTGQGGFFAGRLLEANGALDPTFQPGFNTHGTYDVLVQPSGHLVFAGSRRPMGGQNCTVWGTLPDGALDPAFVPLPNNSQSRGLARDPATGNLYTTVSAAATGLDIEPMRLLPNGVPDPTFSMAGVFPNTLGLTTTIAVQPNGRVLLGGGFPTANGGFSGSVRLLPSGALDPSYNPSHGPGAYMGKVLVQPDGALLFIGGFRDVQGLPIDGLARMLDPNVLSARAQPGADDELLAWPVPAREALHLRLPAARLARELALLDALGRVVRRQEVAAGEAAPTVPLAGLPPGGYLLRVAFAQGPPAYRRVVVE